MFKLAQFPHADQLILNTARSIAYRVALVVTHTIDGRVVHSAIAVGHNAAAFSTDRTGFEIVPLDTIEGL